MKEKGGGFALGKKWRLMIGIGFTSWGNGMVGLDWLSYSGEDYLVDIGLGPIYFYLEVFRGEE